MMTAGPAESDEPAVQLLTEAVRTARELQRELDQLNPRTPMTRLRVVRWGVTVPTGSYSSARLDAEMFVGDEEDPAEVLARLKSWVGQHSPVSETEMEERKLQHERLSYDNEVLERRIAAARDSWRRIELVFSRLGIPVPGDVAEELPF